MHQRQKRFLPHLTATVLLPLALAAAQPALAALPELPRVYLDTTYAPPVGNTINVAAGGNLQAAINSALPGDTIVLQAGATYTGPITLPNKGASTKWIYIRSSAIANLPPPGNRVSPADASDMAVIAGAGTPVIALNTQDGAHHYRFVGIEFKPQAGKFSTGLIRLGSGAETSLSQFPNNLVFDRCYIHGDPGVGGRRGIALNSASTAVIDSHVSDWKEASSDSQAIAGWSGPGPFKIANNYIEGAGENVLFGGADPLIANLVPSDIEFRGNRVAKPLAWRSQSWMVKNLFELKNSRRVLVEGNIFDTSWEAAQEFAINIKSSNQSGTAPWSVTEDFTMRLNVMRHVASAIKFCGQSCDGAVTQQGRRFLVQNNVFEDVSWAKWGGMGTFLQTITPVVDLTVSHNTVFSDGSIFTGGDGGGNTGFSFTDNLVQRGPVGFKGTGSGEGTGTLSRYFPGAVFTKNAIAGGTASLYPAGNYFPAAFSLVGFTNLTTGDYRLISTSAYKGAGSDGKDVGADIVALNAATGCAQDGQCGTPTPPPPPPPPADTTAPVLSGISNAVVGTNGATIAWTTNEASDTQVDYGTTTAYGMTTSRVATMVTSHSQALSGLAPGTTYNYRVRSRDAAGNVAVSSNRTFTTLVYTGPDVTAPSVPAGITFSSRAATGFTVSWQPSTDNVKVTGYRMDVAGDAAFTDTHYRNVNLGLVNTWRVEELDVGKTYYVRIRAYDAAGNISASSVVASTRAP